MRRLSSISGALTALSLAGCVTVGGGDSGALSGTSGPSGSEGTVELKRCASPVATAAVAIENPTMNAVLVSYGLPGDPRPAVRLVLQQSNCFQVVHRDVAMGAIEKERELAARGELTSGSAFGKGQLVAADYTIITEVVFSEENAGGVGAAAGFVTGLMGLGNLGMLAGGVKFKEAQVLLTLVDNRTGVQIATASGTASGTSYGAMGGVLGASAAGGAGGYMGTNQGKVVVAAIIDAMNNLEPHIQAIEVTGR